VSRLVALPPRQRLQLLAAAAGRPMLALLPRAKQVAEQAAWGATDVAGGGCGMGTAPAGGGGVASGAGAPDFAVQKGAFDFEEVWAEDEACAPEAPLAWGVKLARQRLLLATS